MSKLALEVNTKGESRRLDITEDELTKLQTSVGGYIEAVPLSESLIMWVNEEFLFRGDFDPNPVATALFESGRSGPYPIHGTVVFTGGTDSEGDTEGLDNSTLDKLEAVAGATMTMLKQFGFVN